MPFANNISNAENTKVSGQRNNPALEAGEDILRGYLWSRFLGAKEGRFEGLIGCQPLCGIVM
jgi:hypothetical protein